MMMMMMMMMGQKNKKKTSLNFLCLSCLLLSLLAVPALSRNLALLSNQEAPVMEVQHQMMITGEARMVLQEFKRMDIESNDYPISGANPRHDPKSPGRP